MTSDFTFSQDIIAAVIGDPISHSLSPLMHRYWLENAGKSAKYDAIHVDADNLPSFVKAVRASHLLGFNVTVPHKQSIILYLDRLAPAAKALGAVNTVMREGDKLVGYNTDSIGFTTHLREAVPAGITGSALVLGAGGAARAIIYGLLNQDFGLIMITNRSRDKAEAIAADLGRGRAVVVDWQDRHDAVKAVNLIVNTTSLGMTAMPALDLDIGAAGSDCVVYDIVYNPLDTPLLKSAEARGLKAIDGLGMLIHQGAAALKLWYREDKVEPDTQAVRPILLKQLGL